MSNENKSYYKVNRLKNNQIKSIYIFCGNEERDKNKYFTEEEIKVIEERNIEIIYVNELIHYDDSIGTIKLKIIEGMKSKICLEEIYLFYYKREKQNAYKIYKSLTQNNKINLSRQLLTNYLENIGNKKFEIKEKEIYSYDDILALDLNEKEYEIAECLGQKFFLIQNHYSFIVNPFLSSKKDTFLEKAAANSLTTLNSHLLLDSEDIVNKNIYLCLAEDVLGKTSDEEMQLFQINIYYPFLLKKNIFSLEGLKKEKENLLKENKKVLTDVIKDGFKNVDLFYKIYENRKEELNYIETGIKYIDVVIVSENTTKLPLDILFKILNSSEKYSLIKLNNGLKQENIYRLFADKITENGRKIPNLSKALIFKFMREVGRQKSLSIYINPLSSNTETYFLICEFKENGNIQIRCDFSKIKEGEIYDIKKINELFIQHVNPIIMKMKIFLEQNGYPMCLFESLYDENVIVNHIDYFTTIKIKKIIDINSIIGCLSNIFIIESKDFKKGINLRYKRVSNFNKRNSQEAYIIEKQKDAWRTNDIIKGLEENYQISIQEARELIANVISNLEIERDIKKRDIEIKINPGFKTTIIFNKIVGTITIRVDNIDNIKYLKCIPIYLDSVIRLTQMSELQISESHYVCSKEVKDKEKIENLENLTDIISSLEQSFILQKTPVLKNNEIVFEENDENIEEEDRIQNVLDMFFGNDEEEEEEEEKLDFYGGKSESVSDDITNIDGMSLNNPNPFFENMYKNDPALFLRKKENNFNPYSRICASNIRKQPIILTEEEKNNYERDHGAFKEEDILKYGSKPEKQFYYICPRYWCLKTNSPISAEDVKAGKCGKIIPKDAKKVPKGYYVYEFYDKSEHGSQSDYKQHYPGFAKEGSHPDNLCIPCCYKKPELSERKQKCEERLSLKQQVAQNTKGKDIDYIIGADKFPIDRNRWGYLPLVVQQILEHDNTKCQISKTNTNIKPNHTCLLRHGVENNEKQSFIAALADAKYYGTSKKEITIKEMKNQIIESLDIDNYITYQNGNLVIEFSVRDKNVINIEKYTKSELYSKIDKNDENEMRLFKMTVGSFENFISFLKDDNVYINETYLWDIISNPNKNIFAIGINLIILKLTNSGTNVELLCPTNAYQSKLYDSSKPILMLIKNDNYYEPVYSYRDEENRKVINKIFYEKTLKKNESMKTFLELIDPIMRNYCVPLPSNPRDYKFKQPILLDDLIELLEKMNYKIITQVTNYQNKVIGVFSRSEKEEIDGYIPCYPSSINTSYKYILLSHVKNFNNYNKTVNFLREISEKNNMIPCHPYIKIIEDEKCIGLLTNSNQFVPIDMPYPLREITDNIKEMSGTDYINAEKMYGSDVDRIEYIKKLKLETQFYFIFRNTVRNLLNNSENVKMRENIEELIKSQYILYNNKIKKIIKYLKNLTKNTVSFIDYNSYMDINNLSSCYHLSKDKCNESLFCKYKDECQFLLPKKNLITGEENEEIYFKRLGDEIIRYSRIRNFLLNPHSYLSFGKVLYHINENEIIIIESLLTQEYFENLIPANVNKYVNYNTVDNVEPLKSQVYNNRIDFHFSNNKLVMENELKEPITKHNKSIKLEEKEKSEKNKTQKNRPKLKIIS
jgi:hypothetical protein